MMDGQIIAYIFTGVVAILPIFRAGKKSRIVPDSRPSFEEQEQFKKTYHRWKRLEGLLLLVVYCFSAFAWTLSLRGMASLAFDRQNLGVIVLTPCTAYWGFIAVFVGCLSVNSGLESIMKVRYGDRYPAYFAITGGANPPKILRICELTIYPLALVAILIGFRTYTAFDESGMTFQGPLSLKASYPYHRIERLVRVVPIKRPDASVKPLDSHAILFDDGKIWTTRTPLRDPDPTVDPAILEYVSARCGLRIGEVNSLDQLKP